MPLGWSSRCNRVGGSSSHNRAIPLPSRVPAGPLWMVGRALVGFCASSLVSPGLVSFRTLAIVYAACSLESQFLPGACGERFLSSRSGRVWHNHVEGYPHGQVNSTRLHSKKSTENEFLTEKWYGIRSPRHDLWASRPHHPFAP